METVKTINLEKRYGSGDTEINALKGVNISINRGEFVAVVGPSGSGKSTLLHMIGGVDRPSSGSVLVDGCNIMEMNEKQLAVFRRRKVGFVFQFYNLIPVLTAEENITLPLLLDNRPVDRKYVDELLGLLGLNDRRNHLPSELSGGQQQRVSIGRALVYRPSIILADEPTGNLDTKNGREIIDLLRLSVKKYNQTVVVVTHDVDIATGSDRVISLEDGCVATQGVNRK